MMPSARWFIWCPLLLLPGGRAWAQDSAGTSTVTPVTLPVQAADSVAPIRQGVPVVVDGDTVFYIHAPLGPLSTSERAAAIADRVHALERDPRTNADSLYVLDEDGRVLVMLGERAVMSVLAGDAEGEGGPLDSLASAYRDRLAVAFVAGATAWKVETLLWAALYAVLTTLAAFGLAWLIRQVVVRVTRLLGLLRASRRLPSLRFQHHELLSAEKIADAGAALLGVLRVVAWLLLGYFYIVLVLSYFPWTRGLSTQILAYALAPLRTVGTAVLEYLPNVFFVAIIVLVTRGVLALVRSIFRAIGSGTIQLANFEREWAEPTYKLVRFLVLAFALVVIFPYLPGAKSDAFKGVSIFVGVLFSLGSTGAVANLTAGTLLTYTRSFQVGDRVRIGETLGDVVGRTLLVTRVRTLTNVEVTIPNSQVIGGQVLNYTTLAQADGVALQVAITIGYDVPWRRVHELLLAAASATEGIETTPAPFVLQTGLNDYYPAYELNAYTRDASRMRHTLSALHAAVQDAFAEGGVEITSPAFMAIRKGDASTIPPVTSSGG